MTDFAPIEVRDLAEYTEYAYLNYSMYVILDRALPRLGDGLKPVQRRILYAMSELGLNAGAKYKKSARTIGDVLGKFHPHGDSACYEAMVHMAQAFSCRYPLIDGQGNWGSIDDPKSFAAMRYTEAKLTPYAKLLLAETALGTVDWQQNFDGSLQEPALLPARVPNVLLNGSTGIAVGMTTDIPAHNLGEIIAACTLLLDNPAATLADILKLAPAPDFAGGGIIVSTSDEIAQVYARGVGSIRLRASWVKDSKDIIVDSLPPYCTSSKIIEQIAKQIDGKKLPQLVDVRDEADADSPVAIRLLTRSNRVDHDELMAHLFATTELEKNVKINLNVVDASGRPNVMAFDELLRQWLQNRLQQVQRRCATRLEKVEARLHILAGLLIAFLNIDEVIAIIRHHDEPKSELMQRFALSAAQAEAILELKLRHLAKLEEIKITSEQQELEQERQQLQQILDHESQLKLLVKQELEQDAEQYGDPRRTRIADSAPAAKAISAERALPVEPITIILSQGGWVRSVKSHDVDLDSVNYKSGDQLHSSYQGHSNQHLLILASDGRCYSTPAHSLPSGRGQGEPLSTRFDFDKNSQVAHIFLSSPEQHWLLASDLGYGFIVPASALINRMRAGKALISLSDGARVLAPIDLGAELKPGTQLLAATNKGYLLRIELAELPQLNKGKGNKIINIPSAKYRAGEKLSALCALPADQALSLTTASRSMTLNDDRLQIYHGKRGSRGKLVSMGWRNIKALSSSA